MIIESKEDLDKMRKAGRILADTMKKLKEKTVPGITTKELDKLAEKLILKAGAEPAFKGYEGFPATLCASVNETIVHGAPSDYKLKEGDLFSLDLGVKYQEFYADMAITVPVGDISPEKRRLMKVTKKALKLGIKKARAGNTTGDIGNTIQRYVEYQNFNVVRELTGHGIGKELHGKPKVLNYGKRGKGEKLKTGMAICIEPMVTVGDWHIEKSEDGFGYKTKDSSLSAHFEHTVLVTEKGPEILTNLK